MTSPTGRSPDRRRAGGFTLLELIAVLVLISTVLAIAAPSLHGFVHGRQTADAAAQVLALTHLARSQAAAQGAVYRLNVDTAEASCWLTVQQAGAFVDMEADNGRRYQLPGGLTVKVDAPGMEEEQQQDASQVPFVQFYPDGRCDRATIELAGGKGDVLHVTCETPSERFRVVSPSEEERL